MPPSTRRRPRGWPLEWYQDISRHLGLPPELIQRAGRPAEAYEADAAARADYLAAVEEVRRSATVLATDAPRAANDDERRSASWQHHLLAAVWQERLSYTRLDFFENIVSAVLRPMAEELGRPLRLLDYGCGTSTFGRYAAASLPGQVEVLLCDIEGYHFRFAAAQLENAGHPHRCFPIREFRQPQDFGTLDVVYCYTVLEHLPDVAAVLGSFHRHLRPGGVLIETYTGSAAETPHKSDTENAYRFRDDNLDYLAENFTLVHGSLPARDAAGHYVNDSTVRFWARPPIAAAAGRELAARLDALRPDTGAGWMARLLRRSPIRHLTR